MTTATRRLTGKASLALCAIATLSIVTLAPTSQADAYCCAPAFVAAPAYVYPTVSYAYSPVVYTTPVAWTSYSYAYSYPYYTSSLYYSWPTVSVGCVGLSCYSR